MKNIVILSAIAFAIAHIGCSGMITPVSTDNSTHYSRHIQETSLPSAIIQKKETPMLKLQCLKHDLGYKVVFPKEVSMRLIDESNQETLSQADLKHRLNVRATCTYARDTIIIDKLNEAQSYVNLSQKGDFDWGNDTMVSYFRLAHKLEDYVAQKSMLIKYIPNTTDGQAKFAHYIGAAAQNKDWEFAESLAKANPHDFCLVGKDNEYMVNVIKFNVAYDDYQPKNTQSYDDKRAEKLIQLCQIRQSDDASYCAIL